MDCKGKYVPFDPIKLDDRRWPSNVITKAPVWCSVDLRDGNQALVEPMNLQEKLIFFKMLCDVGFKEIEVGFPSASLTEYKILRAIIDDGLIPDDVTIQVLVQAREHLIRRTFEAIDGAKNVILHFYNSTSALQRKVVFQKDMQGITDIAVEAARLVYSLGEEKRKTGTNIRYEYSPESFSGTECGFAVDICSEVMQELHASPENKVILNLPSTVQLSTPNCFADQVEYFCRNLPDRENAVISVHPHNDRGTGIADAELAMMAGAERVEGTMFGNGERTGNVDIVTLALNMYTQGVDPMLDLSHITRLREIYEHCTKMQVPERQPYAGDLVFTAFSGSHQDAINKGINYMRSHKSGVWQVPYLPIDSMDIGRSYEPIIRINSQSGKGGAAFIMQQNFGYILPKAMHPQLGAVVKAEADKLGTELSASDIYSIFMKEFVNKTNPFSLGRHNLTDSGSDGASVSVFSGTVFNGSMDIPINGEGNGPIDAFFNALGHLGVSGYEFISYNEHAIGAGSHAKAVSYIELKAPDKKHYFGVGIHSNINIASIMGVISAIDRAVESNTVYVGK